MRPWPASSVSTEPPYAEPHVRWCERAEGVTPHPTRYQNAEQWPPDGAWPEPAASSGGSRRRFTGEEFSQSQPRKRASASQNRSSMVVRVRMSIPLEAEATAQTNADQRAAERQRDPDPAMDTAGGNTADHRTHVAAESQPRAVAQQKACQQADHPLPSGKRG